MKKKRKKLERKGTCKYPDVRVLWTIGYVVHETKANNKHTIHFEKASQTRRANVTKKGFTIAL